MIVVTLYTSRGCHLCERAKEDLISLQEQFPHRLIEVDVDSSRQLSQAYGLDVPVIEIGPYRLKAPISRRELGVTLAAAIDRSQQIESIEDNLLSKGDIAWSSADRIIYWLSRHYLLLINLIILIYVGLPFLAPVLEADGAEAPARFIYRVYSVVCHQLAYRSLFLFGEQTTYPRAAAGVEGMLTFSQATGLSEGSSAQDLYSARMFLGNSEVGYKVALCQRDVAIYGGLLIFGLLYAVANRRIPGLPWYAWILVGIVPIGIDGLSQLLSQPPFSLLPFRESTPFERLLTGGLFGFTTAWFGYPSVEVAMTETREILFNKLQRIQKKARLAA